MSERSSDCGAEGKLHKAENKKRVKNFQHSDANFKEEIDRKSVVLSMSQAVKDDHSDAPLDSSERPKLIESTIKPGVHKATMNGLASILGCVSVVPSFARRSAVPSPRIDQLIEASTSTDARRSILRENDLSTLNPEPNKFLRIRQLLSRHSTKETKKSIIFVDQRMSDVSLESVVTLVGTSKPLIKSALRSTGSLRSVSSSVRFSLPPETLREEDNALMKIGLWEIVCDVGNDEIADGSIATWRSLRRTRLCKIVMCLAFGLIVPSILIVPVLVYEDNANDPTP